MTGHGGDEFLKFQDFEEIASQDIADAIQEMHVKKRYHELFFMVDTCQAGTLANSLTSPNVVTIGSSKRDQNSYAHSADMTVGVSLIDRFTSATLDFLERTTANENEKTLASLFSSYNPRALYSDPDYRTDMFNRPLNQVPLTDFLGSVLHVQLSDQHYPLVPAAIAAEAQGDWAEMNPFNSLGDATTTTTRSRPVFSFNAPFLRSLCGFAVLVLFTLLSKV